MKRISILLVLALLCGIMLTSCAKLISTDTIEVEAVVAEKDYDPAYVTTRMIMSGKVMIPQTISHPADYDIYLEYEGIRTEWDVDANTYDQYAEGDAIKCYLITETYDDGTVKQKLTAIVN